MKKLSLITALLIFIFSCESNQTIDSNSPSEEETTSIISENNNKKNEEVLLYECSHEVGNSFSPLFDEINSLEVKSDSVKKYSELLQQVSLYFDSLKLIEQTRNKEIFLALDQLNTVPSVNADFYNEIVKRTCLIESNRPSADEFCTSKRLDVYDDLRKEIYLDLDSLIRDAALNASVSDIENPDEITTDDLLLNLENPELSDHYNGYVNWEKYEISYGVLYRTALEQYNAFIDINEDLLKKEGLKEAKKFPTFGE